MSSFNNLKNFLFGKAVMAPSPETALAQFMRKKPVLPDEEQLAIDEKLDEQQGAVAPETGESAPAAVAADAGAMSGSGEQEDDNSLLLWGLAGAGGVLAGAALAADHGHGKDKPAPPAPNIQENTAPDVTDDHYVPDAEADALTTPEDTALVITSSFLLGNDNDVDGDPLTIVSVQAAVNGTVSLGEGGEILFTPDENFNGEATFTYTASDGQGGTDVATVTILVTPVNDLPVIEDDHYVPQAENDALTTPEDTPLLISGGFLLDNDDDVEGGLTIDSVQDAVNGTVSLDEDGNVIFTPDENFNGEATFTYTASDSDGASDTATVTILVTPVNDPPVVDGELSDQVNFDADAVAGVSVAGVFSDIDSGTLTYSATGLPPGLTLDADTGVISGTIDHSASDGTNDNNNTQVYTVTVTANDGQADSAPVVFSWTVNNTIPEFLSGADTEATAANADVYNFGGSEGDGAGTLLGTVTAADQDGDTRTYSITGGNGLGLFAIDAVTGAITLTQTIDDAQLGDYVLSVRADDAEGGSDTATVNISLDNENDAPVGGSLQNRINLDADVVAGVSVAGAFSDADGDTLTYSATGLPPGLTLNADTGVISGTIDHSASDGTNDNNNTQVYTVTVTANDGQADSAPVVFSWTVNNTIPEFLSGADTEATAPNADVYNFGGSEGDGAGTLLGTVTAVDQDGDTRTYSITGGNGLGLFAIDASTGAITLTQTIDDAQLGDYVLSVRADDAEGGSDTATVNITLENVNDPPVGVQDIGVWVPSDPAEQTLSATLYPNGYPIHIPMPTDVDSSLTITATSVPAGVYYWDGDSYEVLTNGTDVTGLLDGDLVYRPTATVSDTPEPLLVLSVSDGDVSLPLTVHLHEMAPNREPATEVTVGDGEHPLNSGSSITENLPALQQSFIDGISVNGYANATIKVYTDFQENPNEDPVPIAERDPGAWNDASAGTQREQEVQVELIIDGIRFVIVQADTIEADFEQSWFFDPDTGLMAATVSYDQIFRVDDPDTSLAEYLTLNPPSEGDVWTVSYNDNDGGSYQARSARFEFFFNDPGDPGVSSNGSALDDQMYGTSGNDMLSGGIGDDYIEGRGDADILAGGVGNDTLVGGVGADMLSGGDGADVFAYLSVDDAGDEISDFTIADGDKLDFVALGVTAAELTVVNAGGSTEVTVELGGTDLTLTLLNVTLTEAEVESASLFS